MVLFSKAYKSGLRYPQYTFITYGWYARDWWQQGDCANEVASLLVNSYAPVIQEFPSELNLGDIGVSLISIHHLTIFQSKPWSQDLGWYVTEYFQKLDNDYNEDINLKNYIDDFEWPFLYSYHCYEATLAFAYALNLTINGINTIRTTLLVHTTATLHAFILTLLVENPQLGTLLSKSAILSHEPSALHICPLNRRCSTLPVVKWMEKAYSNCSLYFKRSFIDGVTIYIASNQTPNN